MAGTTSPIKAPSRVSGSCKSRSCSSLPVQKVRRILPSSEFSALAGLYRRRSKNAFRFSCTSPPVSRPRTYCRASMSLLRWWVGRIKILPVKSLNRVLSLLRPLDVPCPCSAQGRALGKSKHVRALRVLRAAATLSGRKGAVGVDLTLEPGKESIAAGLSSGPTVFGTSPRDVSGNLAVDVRPASRSWRLAASCEWFVRADVLRRCGPTRAGARERTDVRCGRGRRVRHRSPWRSSALGGPE